MIFVSAADVAELIGFNSAQHFLSHRARLEQDEHFPPPMPTSRAPLRWRRDAVEAWSSMRGVPGADPEPPTAPAETAALVEMAGRP